MLSRLYRRRVLLWVSSVRAPELLCTNKASIRGHSEPFEFLRVNSAKQSHFVKATFFPYLQEIASSSHEARDSSQ